MSHELSNTIVGLRLQNIYDLSSRIFLFKFQKPDHREQLIVDTGFRCHLTSFTRTTASEPSVFVRKLRKILGTRRITSISQVGTDRIIEFQFSDGQYHLFLEFYAAGNIVVTDKELNILALFKNVHEGAEHEMIKVGVNYNLSLRQNYGEVPELTQDRVIEGLRKAIDQNATPEKAEASTKTKKKASDLKRALTQTFREWPPVLIDHALLVHEFDPSSSLEDIIANPDRINKLTECMHEASRVQKDTLTNSQSRSFIIAKKRQPTQQQIQDMEGGREVDTANLLYDDYQPFKPKQFEQNSELVCLEFEGFNKAVDEFYSSIEGQRLDSKLQEREANAKKKLEETKRQHQERLGSLKQAQTLNERKAGAIEANIERVREATEAVNGLIAQGMDWADIARLIESEQRKGNQVAQLIKLPLKLYENTVTLLLAEPSALEDDIQDQSDSETTSSDSEDESQRDTKKQNSSVSEQSKRLTIDIDLSLSPWANASQYYDQKKSAAVKEERTAQISNQALKNAEKKITADLKKGLSKEKDVLRPIRRTFWFEKFYCFISSDGYLVLAAKNPQQAEILYRRYLKTGDVFVHADTADALVVVIKNNTETPDAPIPPSTLSQAGTLSVSSSNAWDSKALMPAWWVPSTQVTKTNAHGDLLPVGEFQVRGEKIFLPPVQLLVGIGIIFQITEESKANHTKHRISEQSVTEEATIEAELEEVETQNLVEAETRDTAKVEAVQEDSDDSEDFLDAAPVTTIDSDDEDFPDVNPAADHDSDDDDNTESRGNPLQSASPPRSDVVVPKLVSNPLTLNEETTADGDDILSNAPSEATTTGKSIRRHLSANERRLLKRGIKPNSQPTTANSSQTPSLAINEDDMIERQNSTATSASQKQKSSAPLPRGKRTKQKKAAAKYADQDEDDRAAALARLGTQAGQDKKAIEAAERQAKEEAELKAKVRRREQHLRAQAISRAAEAARAENTAANPGEDDAEDDDNANLDILSCLVGKPLPGDTIVAAWPVCAPFPALANYKFRTKLQPGSMKKGKAAREVLGKWQLDAKNARNVDTSATDTERIWPREAELLAGIKDTEIIGAMAVGKVRVVTAGGKDGKGAGGGGGGKGMTKGKTKGKTGGSQGKKR
jgi:nuclear export mediator factor NEMF